MQKKAPTDVGHFAKYMKIHVVQKLSHHFLVKKLQPMSDIMQNAKKTLTDVGHYAKMHSVQKLSHHFELLGAF